MGGGSDGWAQRGDGGLGVDLTRLLIWLLTAIGLLRLLAGTVVLPVAIGVTQLIVRRAVRRRLPAARLHEAARDPDADLVYDRTRAATSDIDDHIAGITAGTAFLWLTLTLARMQIGRIRSGAEGLSSREGKDLLEAHSQAG
jgi:hypothetical protein